MKPRTGLFFDGANHHEALKRSGIDMDYKKMFDGLSAEYRIVTARYYTGLSPNPEHAQLHQKVTWLSHNGFVVVSKPVKMVSENKVKANMDIEIAVDMLTYAPRLDQIVLFSGDGDFTYAVDAIQKMGVTVAVSSIPELTADELRRQADRFFDIRRLVTKKGKVK